MWIDLKIIIIIHFIVLSYSFFFFIVSVSHIRTDHGLEFNYFRASGKKKKKKRIKKKCVIFV